MKKIIITLLSVITLTTGLISCKSEHEKEWEKYQRDKQTKEMYDAEWKEKMKQSEREVVNASLQKQYDDAPDSSLTKLLGPPSH